MDLKGVEQAILERLAERAGEFPARIFPNNPSVARMLAHAQGEYLLRYAGSQYTAARPIKPTGFIQDRTTTWAVTARSRNLSPERNNPGIYSMLELSRLALVGWTVPGVPDATRISLSQDGFTEENEGIWEYSQLFSFTFPEVTA